MVKLGAGVFADRNIFISRRTNAFLLALVFALVLLMSVLTPLAGNWVGSIGSASAFTGSGTGSTIDPFIVNSCDDLQSIEVDATNYVTEGKLYVLDGDIDCTATASWNGGLGFDPISEFYGVFDGKGYNIDGLVIDRPTEDYVGLFGGTSGSSAIVANFSMTNVDVTGRSYVGSVAGYSNGTVLGVEVTGSVSGASSGSAAGTGGIVGRQQSTEVSLSRLSFSGTVTNTGRETGGIVGTAGNASLENSYANATVTGTDYVGGLVGLVGSCCNGVTNSYAIGSVVGSSHVGGAIGAVSDMNETTVENIFAASSISGTTNTGGVIGDVGSAYGPDVTIGGLYFDETVAGMSACYASASVTVTCTARNSDGLDAGHFYDSANAPLTAWDFTNIWQEEIGDYPSLRALGELTGPGSVSGISVSYPDIPLTASVAFSAPVSSGTFPVNDYEVEVKFASSAWSELLDTDSDSSSPLSIDLPDFDTDYTLRVRAITVYGSGPWTEYSFSTGEQAQVEVGNCTELEQVDDTPANAYAAILLTEDIDCSGVSDFEPLNWDGDFSGAFDGQGHSISSLNIMEVDSSYAGLFSVTSNASLQNVSFNDPTILGTEDSYFCGTLAGYTQNTDIYNVEVNNTSVTCSETVGGIAGRFESDSNGTTEVENVTVSGSITAEGQEVDYGWGPYFEGGYNAGGLFGRVDASYEGSVIISQSFSNASVVADSNDAGGIIGQANAEIDDDSEIPTTLLIQDSYSAGSVTGGYNAGGIIGAMEAYNDGYDAVSEIEIENAYSSATVSAEYSAGGIVGYMDDPYEVGEQYVLNNVFAAGTVTADTLDYALIGSDDGLGDGSLVIDNSYFDQTTTGQSEASAYDDTVSGWTAVNTDGSEGDYFKNNSSNPPLDQWDFENVWLANAGYPLLRDTPYEGPQDALTIGSAEDSSLILLGQSGCDGVGEWQTLKESDLSVRDAGFAYPKGFVEFELLGCTTGGSATITVTFTGDYDPSKVTIRKHNTSNGVYTTLSQQNANLSVTRIILENQPAIQATYTLVDGGSLDQDGLENGVIVDPVGLGVLSVGSPNTGLR